MNPIPITQPLNFPITPGTSKEFPPLLVSGSNVMCTAEFTGINAADCVIELQQSIDGVFWGTIPDSSKTLATSQSSHTWNVRGLVSGAFIRVKITATGTVSTGILTKIKLLSNG
jgi:hypothetical protein